MSTKTALSPDVKDVAVAPAADIHPGVHELIKQRWSPRAFSDRMISDEDLVVLLEAARWASSSNNEQPWRFLVAKRSDVQSFDEFLNLLYPGNRIWARHAAVLLFTAARKFGGQGKTENRFALHDTGQAIAQLILQGTHLGIYGHALGGFDHDLARTVLKVPEDYDLGPGLALGYPGSLDYLSPELRTRELAARQRKPLSELVFGASWDVPASINLQPTED